MFKKILALVLALGPSLCSANVYTSGNFYYYWEDSSLPSDSHTSRYLGCPSTYPRVVSGNCGARDNDEGSTNLNVAYSGPSNGPTVASVWKCTMNNGINYFRTVALRLGVVCSK